MMWRDKVKKLRQKCWLKDEVSNTYIYLHGGKVIKNTLVGKSNSVQESRMRFRMLKSYLKFGTLP